MRWVCLRAEGDTAQKVTESSYPLAPNYLVHVGEDGAILLPFTQAKQILDRLKRTCTGRDLQTLPPQLALIERRDKAKT